MTTLTWSEVGTRFFETGTDRGVLYVGDNPGVAWSGLTAVRESPSGGGANPYYIDGFKYQNVAEAEEFEATIEALFAPPEFGVCDGTASIAMGLFATQQPRKTFGFSYRTKLGNDTDGVDHAYKIHVVYNALAGPSSRDNSTISDSASPNNFSWGITTKPPRISGLRPTSHYIIDSRFIDQLVLDQLEGLLYGTTDTPPQLPPPEHLVALFGGVLPFKPIEVESGVYEIHEVDPSEAATIMSPVASPPPSGEVILWLDSSNPEYVVPHLLTGD